VSLRGMRAKEDSARGGGYIKDNFGPEGESEEGTKIKRPVNQIVPAKRRADKM